MSKYLLVQFSDGTSIIPRKWVEHQEEKELMVAFPSKAEYKFFRKYINDCIAPSEMWSSYQAEMILESGKMFDFQTIILLLSPQYPILLLIFRWPEFSS